MPIVKANSNKSYNNGYAISLNPNKSIKSTKVWNNIGVTNFVEIPLPEDSLGVTDENNLFHEAILLNANQYGPIITLKGLLGSDQASSGYQSVGTVVGRMPIRDNYGTFLGYFPIYDNVSSSPAQPLSISQGGTNSISASGAIVNLLPTSNGEDNQFLKNVGSGLPPIWHTAGDVMTNGNNIFYGINYFEKGLNVGYDAGGVRSWNIQLTGTGGGGTGWGAESYLTMILNRNTNTTSTFIGDTSSGNILVVNNNNGQSSVSISGLTYTNNDVEITDSTKGIILRSPNGSRWRITVDNTGALVRTSI